jgi:hypothetical protein
MSRPPGMNRAGVRRIRECPDCHRLQYIVPGPARPGFICRDCHRVFRVTEAGDMQASGLRIGPTIGVRQSPNRFFNDRSLAPTEDANRPAALGWIGHRIRRFLDWAHPTAIVSFALAAAIGAVPIIMTIAEARYPSVRRPLLEGSTAAAKQHAGESARWPVRKSGEAEKAPKSKE